jgi:DNA invertase Pin-like site-specific DNA recombinase
MAFYGYARVSTPTQEEKGYGLMVQRDAIREYCRREGGELLEIFEDRGVSGAGEGLQRAGLLGLLAALAPGDAVVVLNTSRLWRSDVAKVLIRREVIRKGARVVSIEQPRYDIYTKDPGEVLINGMFELLDEYERMSIAIKLAQGRAAKAARGAKPAGVTPMGYRYAPDKKSLVIHEEEAELVRRIFMLACEGLSVQRIADSLNSEGLCTRRGRPWTKAATHKILRNRFYTGTLSHGQRQMKGTHPPIVSHMRFRKAQDGLKKRRKLTL